MDSERTAASCVCVCVCLSVCVCIAWRCCVMLFFFPIQSSQLKPLPGANTKKLEAAAAAAGFRVLTENYTPRRVH